MKRYSHESRRQQPRPLLLLWLVPMLWSLVGSSIHNPGGCAGEMLCKKDAQGHHLCEGEAGAAHSEEAAVEATLACIPVAAQTDEHDADEHHHDEAAEGHEAEEHHHAEGPKGQWNLGAPVLASGSGCFECQWISASALSLAASIDFHLVFREITASFSQAYSLISRSTPSPFSRGPPVSMTLA